MRMPWPLMASDGCGSIWSSLTLMAVNTFSTERFGPCQRDIRIVKCIGVGSKDEWSIFLDNFLFECYNWGWTGAIRDLELQEGIGKWASNNSIPWVSSVQIHLVQSRVAGAQIHPVNMFLKFLNMKKSSIHLSFIKTKLFLSSSF